MKEVMGGRKCEGPRPGSYAHSTRGRCYNNDRTSGLQIRILKSGNALRPLLLLFGRRLVSPIQRLCQNNSSSISIKLRSYKSHLSRGIPYSALEVHKRIYNLSSELTAEYLQLSFASGSGFLNRRDT